MKKPYLVQSALREFTSDLRWAPLATASPCPDSFDFHRRTDVQDTSGWKLQQRRVMVDYWRAGNNRGDKPKHIASQWMPVCGGPGDDIEYVYMTERSEWLDVPFHNH
jgi:hypothetical protein